MVGCGLGSPDCLRLMRLGLFGQSFFENHDNAGILDDTKIG